jgi:hypothetical protein
MNLEPDACEFLSKEVYFWGYKVTADCVAMGETERERESSYKYITKCRLTPNSERPY